MNIDKIVVEARNSILAKKLMGGQANGAEGYVQAFAHIAYSNPEMKGLALRRMTSQYLAVTADQWSNAEYRAGAKIGRKTVKSLQ